MTNIRNKNMSDADKIARRRLLKIGFYVPPAVFGMVLIGYPETASAVAGSCCPSACQPCVDLGTGINSEEGRPLTKRGINKKTRKCRKKRRKRGC